MRSFCGATMVVLVVLMVLEISSAQEANPARCSSEKIECGSNCRVANGSDGCPTCVCDPPTCENTPCESGSVCQMQKVQCFTTPCYDQPTCVPEKECPMIKCAPYCFPGTGTDGCPACDCPPSCETVRCSAGHECRLVNVTCNDGERCFPEARCVSIENLCTGTPNTGRCTRPTLRWSYNSKTDTCKRVLYSGCTPSSNTFGSLKECEDSCKTQEPTCNACGDRCFTIKRKNKCPRCVCPNPCRRIRCREGFECKLKDSFIPRPYCAPKSSCPSVACTIRCSTPLKTDKNGCQLCECS